ncbi:hypothetical protein ACIO13_36940 [Streptomyces sp. NPDC087425]|uniref:hypothetical protein n=1 Tax=Streptomyces sp. NPDC087425 TaxID=3365787 RepID=UPI0037FCE70F
MNLSSLSELSSLPPLSPLSPLSRRAVTALSATLLATAGTLVATAQPAGAAPASDRYYQTWATDVNVRVSNADPEGCGRRPSVANCPDVRGRVQPGTQFYVYCQGPGGQTVGGNPYWLMIGTDRLTGWMASYYVDYPNNRLPDVPDCPGQGVSARTTAPTAAKATTGTKTATAAKATERTSAERATAKGTAAEGGYSVTAYETVNIRSKPNTSSRAFDKILAGQTRNDALCWTHGETVRDHGYTNDIWIGFTEGWASAVYLKGDAYAGLPASAQC